MRATLGIVVPTMAGVEVDRICRRTLSVTNMMSSMAVVICGGLDEMGLCGFRVRLKGCSSSWKAFSTVRRKKKVERVAKGFMRRDWTFRERFEVVRKDGVSVSVAEVLGGRHFSVTKRV